MVPHWVIDYLYAIPPYPAYKRIEGDKDGFSIIVSPHKSVSEETLEDTFKQFSIDSGIIYKNKEWLNEKEMIVKYEYYT